MSIPFLDLNAAVRELRTELSSAYERVMSSGWFILGAEVEAFEREFAAYCETRHCVGVGNGLDALVLALRACEVGAGDDVLVPSNTFIATWLAVSAVGARPVPVEPDERTYNITVEGVRQAWTPRTRAVIPVHLYGQPADLEPIVTEAHRRGARVIEDAAQAHGARCRGRRAGSLADAAAFSFYPGKNLGAFGDGGAITTSDDALADRVRLLRNYGSRVKYHHDVIGVNSRLDELQAALLRVRLARLDEWNARRRALATLYLERLASVDGLRLPYVPDWAEPVWHLFVVAHADRERLHDELKRAGIGVMVHYPVPPHASGAYAGQVTERLPVAERLSREVLSLPMGPHLSNDAVATVSSTLARLGARR
jgi:dTDP-4-amino-4,6-dideoxygalactose transaminase